MLTHRAPYLPPYLPNGKAYEVQTWYTDGGRRPASVTGHDLKGQGHTGPINGDTHRPPYLPNGKAYELQAWYRDGG